MRTQTDGPLDADVLEENPHWTGMLARRRTTVTDAAMTNWWEQVLRYSRRDQLSFVPTMRRHGLRLASMAIDSHTSPWHEWPRAEGRDRSRRGSGLRDALRPPSARIGVLEQALDETRRSLAYTTAHRDETVARLDRTIARDGADAVQLEIRRMLAQPLKQLKMDGFTLVGLEQTTGSESLFDFRFPRRTALVVGHERQGITPELLELLDHVVEIPVYGLPFSHNVATAASLALYEYCRQFPSG